MMLRSSSTPVLGSLLSSFSESPNNNHYHSEVPNTTHKNASTSIHHNCSNSRFSNKHAAGSHNFTTSFCNSSPISPSIAEISGSSRARFRRAQSEGNLEGLVSAEVDEFSFANQPSKKFARKPHCPTLEAIPSFSFHNLGSGQEDEDGDQEEEDIEEEELAKVTINLLQDSLGMENFGPKGDRRYKNGYANPGFEEEREEMYLARGLGISDASFTACNGGQNGGSGGGHGCRPVAFDGNGGDSHGLGIEEYYKRLLEENPCNPLCLRNYAQFLHQTKRDFQSAEEYYSRAILADPKDGEVLSQYANLVWETYHDEDRAQDYFERAIKASADDSHVQAAYASFLWETEDDEDQDDESYERQATHTLILEGVTA